MTITWIVAGNATIAKIYALGINKGELTHVATLDNPEGRWTSSELGFERPSRSEARTHDRSFEHADPKDTELYHFVKHVTDKLESGRVHNEFSRLVLVAAPHFHGLLRKEMNAHLMAMVHKEIEKDYSNLPLPELYKHVIALD